MGVPVGILPRRLVRKNYDGVATRWWENAEDTFIRFDRMYERDRETHRHRMTHRPRLHSIARQKPLQAGKAWRNRDTINARDTV